MKTYCWLCLYRLRRVSAHVEEGENTLIVILSGIADSSIARWFLLCQMLNSKSAWQQMVCISFSYREVRTEQPPSPFISKLALHFQTDHCCKDLLRNSSPLSLSENRTSTHSVDLGNSLGLSLWFSTLTRSSRSVPYVFVTKLRRCFCCLWWRTSWVLTYSAVALVVNHSG